MLKRALAMIASVVLLSAIFIALAAWLFSRDEVAHLRATAKVAKPLPPLLRSAVLAAEPFLLEPPQISPRTLALTHRRTVGCGPPIIAWTVVRSLSPPRRHRQWKIDATVTSYVVGHLFTPEELLRIYAHEVYLGTVDGRHVLGMDAASRTYFGKTAATLREEEAAMLAAMIRQPNAFSPIRYPERARARRDVVLRRMRGNVQG